MENQIYNLCSPLIRLKPLSLFLLTSIPLFIKVTATGSETFDLLGRTLFSFGSIIFFSWVYTVGMKSIENLNAQGISILSYKFYSWVFIWTILFYLLTIFGTEEQIFLSGAMQFHFVKPIFFPVLFLLSFLGLITLAARLLVSAELNKHAEFGDYFSTLLLFMITPIGFWFIQPRVQKL